MKKMLLALAVMALVVACNGPTVPDPPPPPPPGPAVVTFTALPAEVGAGEEVRVTLEVRNVTRSTATMRLDMGPVAADVILYHSPTLDQEEARFIAWLSDTALFTTRRWPTESRTFTLTVSTAHGSATEQRRVVVR